jgi:hypothetical protein
MAFTLRQTDGTLGDLPFHLGTIRQGKDGRPLGVNSMACHTS